MKALQQAKERVIALTGGCELQHYLMVLDYSKIVLNQTYISPKYMTIVDVIYHSITFDLDTGAPATEEDAEVFIKLLESQ
jgi:hypothetical protein